MNRWAQRFRAWGRNLKRFRNWTFFVGTAPAAPSDFHTTDVGSTAANFAWTDNSDNETIFVFQRKLNTAPASAWNNCATSAANTTVIQITGFRAGNVMICRMRSENAYGVSSWVLSNVFQMLPAGFDNPDVPLQP